MGDVTQYHDLIVTKTRAAFLKDQVIREAGEDLGKQLAGWLSTGEPVAAKPVRTASDADMGKARAAIEATEDADKLADFKSVVIDRTDAGFYTTQQGEELKAAIDAKFKVMAESEVPA